MGKQTAILELPLPVEAPVREPKPKRRARGEGGLIKRHNTWWVRYYHNGERKEESSGSDKKQVAVELLQRRLTESKDQAIPDAKLTYENMRDALYRDYEVRGHKSLLTRVDGTRYVGTVPALDKFFEGCRTKEITTAKIKDFIEDRQLEGVSNSGINGSLAVLRRMFWLQVQESRFPRNLVPHFPMLPKNKPREDFLTQEQYEKVLAALPDDLKPLFVVSYHTGARKSELLTLRWADVDMDAGLLLFRETKNREPREVPFIGPLGDTLKALRAEHPDTEFVFVRKSGRPIKDFRRAWELAIKAVGLEGHRWHGNRRSLAVNLVASGVDEQTAMSLTGHKDRATFRGYNVLVRAAKQAAAAKVTEHLIGKKS